MVLTFVLLWLATSVVIATGFAVAIHFGRREDKPPLAPPAIDLTSVISIAEPASPAGPLERNAVRVLVVDDAEEVRRLFRTALDLEVDFTVIGEAENGVEAVEQARALRPDVIVLDWQMPVMDGPATIPVLRRVTPTASIVLFSSRYGPTAEEAALAAGADIFIEKQSNLDELINEIRTLRQPV